MLDERWRERVDDDLRDLRETDRALSIALLGGPDGAPGVHEQLRAVRAQVGAVQTTVDAWDARVTAVTDAAKHALVALAKGAAKVVWVVLAFEAARLAPSWWPSFTGAFTAVASAAGLPLQ